MKKCCIENCNNNVWSNGFCKNHIAKKPLNQCMVKPSLTAKKVVNDGHNQQRDMFMDIWKKRKHYSEVSGVYLGSEAMSTYFHHILPKEKYPEACLDEENIILLSLLEHSNVENDIYRYEEVNKRREQLKIKYNL